MSHSFLRGKDLLRKGDQNAIETEVKGYGKETNLSSEQKTKARVSVFLI